MSRLHERICSPESGPRWLPVRAALTAAAWAYGGVIAVRNRRYDQRPQLTESVPCPVISVGNITTGGTGKTPLVIEMARRLLARGMRPAVVSRGYKAGAAAEADELLLVRRHCPGIVTVADPDRVVGARRALELGAGAVVLDDAFQHRRIHRDLDIVVIDCTRPFGYDRLLPRGLLREPLTSLRRAGAIVLSRADAVSEPNSAELESRIRRFNQVAPLLRTRHRPTHLAGLDGRRTELASLQAKPVVCCAGIGNFRAFIRTIESLGAQVRAECPLADHARFDAAEIARLRDAAARAKNAQMLLVTEKDLVKMDPAAWRAFPLPIHALAISIEFLDGSDAIIDRLLDATLTARQSGGPDVHPQIPAR